MPVDLVEVVLQNLHLVLGGAVRGLSGHGPGAATPPAKQWPLKAGTWGRRSSCLPLTEPVTGPQ